MMVRCDESLNPEYSKMLSISSASDTFTIFLFSPFLSFSLLDRFQINLNYIIHLSTALSCHINPHRHTRRSCLHFFSVSGYIFVGTQRDLSIFVGARGNRDWLSFLFLNRSEFRDAFVRLFPVGTHDWRFCPSSTLRVVWSVPLFSFSYRCTVSTRSWRWQSLCLTYIAKSLLCCFPFEFWSCFSAVPCERWLWST